MSAVTLSELNQVGIAVTVMNGRLRLSAPTGRLTAGLRERISAHREDLMRELADLRAHLLALAADEGLPAGLVHGESDADVAACAGMPVETLRAYLRALEAGQRMDAGQVPPAWGEPVAVTCEGCGPVLLWAACPPVVKACPWCFRRKTGRLVGRPKSR